MSRPSSMTTRARREPLAARPGNQQMTQNPEQLPPANQPTLGPEDRKPAAAFPEPARWPGTVQALYPSAPARDRKAPYSPLSPPILTSSFTYPLSDSDQPHPPYLSYQPYLSYSPDPSGPPRPPKPRPLDPRHRPQRRVHRHHAAPKPTRASVAPPMGHPTHSSSALCTLPRHASARLATACRKQTESDALATACRDCSTKRCSRRFAPRLHCDLNCWAS
jgi:hypothetical protein